MKEIFQQTTKGIIFNIKVITKASSSGIVGWENNELKIRLTAVPEKGKANEELIRLLAKFFNRGKSKIEIIQGKKSHHKKICLSNINLTEIEEKFKNLL